MSSCPPPQEPTMVQPLTVTICGDDVGPQGYDNDDRSCSSMQHDNSHDCNTTRCNDHDHDTTHDVMTTTTTTRSTTTATTTTTPHGTTTVTMTPHVYYYSYILSVSSHFQYQRCLVDRYSFLLITCTTNSTIKTCLINPGAGRRPLWLQAPSLTQPQEDHFVFNS